MSGKTFFRTQGDLGANRSESSTEREIPWMCSTKASGKEIKGCQNTKWPCRHQEINLIGVECGETTWQTCGDNEECTDYRKPQMLESIRPNRCNVFCCFFCNVPSRTFFFWLGGFRKAFFCPPNRFFLIFRQNAISKHLMFYFETSNEMKEENWWFLQIFIKIAEKKL